MKGNTTGVQIENSNSINKNKGLYNISERVLYSDTFWGIAFILPFIIGLSIFMAFPLIRSIYLSLTDYNIFEKSTFIGMDNYIDLLHDDYFKKSAVVTFKFVVGLVPLNIFLSVLIASLLRMRERLLHWVRSFRKLPLNIEMYLQFP